MAASTLKGLLNSRPRFGDGDIPTLSGPLPYAELQSERRSVDVSIDKKPVFITARFRTGSTLLWNIFRSIDGLTSYYEPLNERRWFSREARGTHTDHSHQDVKDYWREYEGLEELAAWYRQEWICRNLYMDESFWDFELKRYIELLCERAPGRPVLQFNRVDFRLPWLRKNFPHAQIVHLFRHPRDQWCSTLVDLEAFPNTHGMNEFQHHDHYYLRMWANDLKYQFPFLEEQVIKHPYRLFYCIWRLSYSFGKRYSHISFAYEDILNDTRKTLITLLSFLEIKVQNWLAIERLVSSREVGKWRRYASDQWFRQHEEECEALLSEVNGK